MMAVLDTTGGAPARIQGDQVDDGPSEHIAMQQPGRIERGGAVVIYTQSIGGTTVTVKIEGSVDGDRSWFKVPFAMAGQLASFPDWSTGDIILTQDGVTTTFILQPLYYRYVRTVLSANDGVAVTTDVYL